MSIAQPETSQPTFTPEQKRVLGAVYRFLIDLGQKRMCRLQQQSLGTEEPEKDVRNKAQQIENICHETR